jgi:hypothetical protein
MDNLTDAIVQKWHSETLVIFKRIEDCPDAPFAATYSRVRAFGSPPLDPVDVLFYVSHFPWSLRRAATKAVIAQGAQVIAAIERHRPEIMRFEDGGCDGLIMTIDDPAWNTAVDASGLEAAATVLSDHLPPELVLSWTTPWRQLVETGTADLDPQ